MMKTSTLALIGFIAGASAADLRLRGDFICDHEKQWLTGRDAKRVNWEWINTR